MRTPEAVSFDKLNNYSTSAHGIWDDREQALLAIITSVDGIIVLFKTPLNIDKSS